MRTWPAFTESIPLLYSRLIILESRNNRGGQERSARHCFCGGTEEGYPLCGRTEGIDWSAEEAEVGGSSGGVH
ncbi:hypothetical protein ILYODFUR_017695 [Ilyodon furcidens]|uniref:Uncharacterized protein n=1 Tax=Ilyodon furcidens TaxID=33524 RepID=A0ABV0TJI2_9TELE